MPAARHRWISIVTRVVVCAGLLLAAGVVVAWLRWSAPKPSAADRGDVRTRVLVMTSHPTPVRRQWQGYGTAAPVHASDVPSRVTAVAVDRPDQVRAGRAVVKGDLLVQVVVDTPQHLTAEQETLFRRLAEVDQLHAANPPHAESIGIPWASQASSSVVPASTSTWSKPSMSIRGTLVP